MELFSLDILFNATTECRDFINGKLHNPENYKGTVNATNSQNNFKFY